MPLRPRLKAMRRSRPRRLQDFRGGFVGWPCRRIRRDPLAPGFLHFVLPDSPGVYGGLAFRGLAAKSTAGFIPLQSDARLGYHLKLTLWPDQYQVRVSLRSDTRLSQWVTVEAGRHLSSMMDLGVVTDDVLVLHGEDALKRLAGSLALSGPGSGADFQPVSSDIRRRSGGTWHGPRAMDRASVQEPGWASSEPSLAWLASENARRSRVRRSSSGACRCDDGRQVAGRWREQEPGRGQRHAFSDGRVFPGQLYRHGTRYRQVDPDRWQDVDEQR